jgi:hypothetical protein
VLFFAPKLVDAIMSGSAVDIAAGAAAKGVRAHAPRAAAAASSRALLAHAPPPTAAGVRAALLTAVPFVLAAAAAVWLGKRSQEKGERCRHMAVPWFISALMFLLFSSAASHSPQAGFVCLTLAVVTATSPNALLNTLASSVSQGPAQAVSLSLYNAGGLARGRPAGTAAPGVSAAALCCVLTRRSLHAPVSGILHAAGGARTAIPDRARPLRARAARQPLARTPCWGHWPH